ncbi:MAG: carbon storage regulator [Ruminococcus sp.]|nr:carbon storage regulator [Ruminococcus sp.]MCM1380658.1 carbon storage regulator [Muribaculaceae bacterium]MCM1479490.1 carbon storage regulator [Muribaculaceae bacterium]
MLVVTRKNGEGLLIGENVRVTVVETSKDRVKIGIDAPPDVRIIRNELFDTERFNMQAALHKPAADLLSIIKAQGQG